MKETNWYVELDAVGDFEGLLNALILAKDRNAKEIRIRIESTLATENLGLLAKETGKDSVIPPVPRRGIAQAVGWFILVILR